MGRKGLSASERRGVLVVAAIALLIIGCGLAGRRCSSSNDEPKAQEIYELLKADSTLLSSRKDSIPKHKNDTVKKRKRKGAKKERDRKTYRQRNPLDEPI